MKSPALRAKVGRRIICDPYRFAAAMVAVLLFSTGVNVMFCGLISAVILDYPKIVSGLAIVAGYLFCLGAVGFDVRNRIYRRRV